MAVDEVPDDPAVESLAVVDPEEPVGSVLDEPVVALPVVESVVEPLVVDPAVSVPLDDSDSPVPCGLARQLAKRMVQDARI